MITQSSHWMWWNLELWVIILFHLPQNIDSAFYQHAHKIHIRSLLDHDMTCIGKPSTSFTRDPICKAIQEPWSYEGFFSETDDKDDEDDSIWLTHNDRHLMIRDVSCDCIQVSNEDEKDSSFFDLSSPREWMEHLEYLEYQHYKEGDESHDVTNVTNVTDYSGGTAYTVIRCDGIHHHHLPFQWNIWGKSFHLDRLKQSFLLLNPNQEGQVGQKGQVGNSKYENAQKDSDIMLHALLQHMETHIQQMTLVDHSMIQTMVTLVWMAHPPHADHFHDPIHVRGHIKYITLLPSPNHAYAPLPSPIIATLALPFLSKKEEPQHSLPNRHMNSPRAKASSWCRIRRPLEHVFKPNGVGEVILTRTMGTTLPSSPVTQQLELLEGLTSNFFVIFANDTLRTAEYGVLHGYARELVIQYSKSCGLTFDPTPILFQDLQHCVEAFVTSSIRLIVPVHTILIPTDSPILGQIKKNDKDIHEFSNWISIWTQPDSSKWSNTSRSKALYHEICKHGKI